MSPRIHAQDMHLWEQTIGQLLQQTGAVKVPANAVQHQRLARVAAAWGEEKAPSRTTPSTVSVRTNSANMGLASTR